MTPLLELRQLTIGHTGFLLVAGSSAAASIALVPGACGLLGAVLALLMSAIALYDARNFIIPDALSAAALALAFAYAVAAEPDMAVSQVALSLLRAACSGGAFLAIKLAYRSLRGREGIGMGDVKLAAVAGAWLDWYAMVTAIDFALLAALGVYLVLTWASGRPLRATNALPFGLFLAPAIWAAWLAQTLL